MGKLKRKQRKKAKRERRKRAKKHAAKSLKAAINRRERVEAEIVERARELEKLGRELSREEQRDKENKESEESEDAGACIPTSDSSRILPSLSTSGANIGFNRQAWERPDGLDY
jgi:hypothetical protein